MYPYSSRVQPVDLARRQLDLLARISELEPPVSLMGGFAEDALLDGVVTRPHEDIDLLFARRDHELRMSQLTELGFTDWAIQGEAEPGMPFYLFGQNGDLKVDLGIADEIDGGIWVRVHKLAFSVGGGEAPAQYRFKLPDDIFDHPTVELEGIPIKPIQPLGLYQIRAGIARRGSFGPLSERHQATLTRLRETFFPGLSEQELLPETLELRT